MKEQVVLSVYFSGTNFELSDEYLSGLLFTNTDLSTDTEDTTYESMGFDGCGIEAGTMGEIFGAELPGQSDVVLAKVKKYVKQGKKVVVNIYGHSRGAV